MLKKMVYCLKRVSILATIMVIHIYNNVIYSDISKKVCNMIIGNSATPSVAAIKRLDF